MISVGYYYTGNKNYIDKFKDCELIILIDDESYVDDLIKYNLNIKIIKYDDSFYDIVFSENDNLENINANKKIVIGKFEKHKTGIQYIEEFDLKEILKMPEVKQNKFSIIVPNFNNGDWIDKTIESVIKPIYSINPWGYSTPYYIAAIHSCHPNYATYLLKHQVTDEEIDAILQQIPEDKKTNYDERCIEQIAKKNFLTVSK